MYNYFSFSSFSIASSIFLFCFFLFFWHISIEQMSVSKIRPIQFFSSIKKNASKTTNKASTNPKPLKNPFFTSSPSFIPTIYKFSEGLI